MNQKSLVEMLRDYAKNGRIPFHMPGHRRCARYDYLNDLGAALDVTEIDGFDNLHDASGILADGTALLEKIYGSRRSFYLVNGSTCGILAAVRCAVPFGGDVIMARNCHKAVYNAVELIHAKPRYLFPSRDPEFGFCLGVSPQSVREALRECPTASAVVVTSPTYDGIISDVAALAEICHSHDIPLLIDEAHGAHLGFLEAETPGACAQGADIVIQSFHKTLPSLTQTAVAHVCGDRIDPERFAAELSVFETSSPSYLLMASLDGCARLLADPERQTELFTRWRTALDELDARLSELSGTRVYMRPRRRSVPDVFAFDRSKLPIMVEGMSGAALAAFLRRRGVEPEMTSARYVLLMTGADVEKNEIDRLVEALRAAELTARSETPPDLPPDVRPCQKTAPFEARGKSVVRLPVAEIAPGSVGADYVFAYPPGIPILAPGEILSKELLAVLRLLPDSGLNPATLRGAFDGTLAVIDERLP